MDFIDKAEGSILDSRAELQVIPVNCVPGVMGKGLAKDYADRWPFLRRIHRGACEAGYIAPGHVVIKGVEQTRDVVLFPTKRHWKNPSRMEDIKSGMADLVRQIQEIHAKMEEKGIEPWKSIAFPALGCGLGGLPWAYVRDAIVTGLAPLLHLPITVMLYAPKEGAA